MKSRFIKKLSILIIACMTSGSIPCMSVSAKVSSNITSIIANAEVEDFGETIKNFEIIVNNVDLTDLDKDDFIIDNAVINHAGTVEDIKVKDVKIENNKITLDVNDFLSIKSDGSVRPEEMKVTCTENDELSFSYSDINKIVSKTAEKFESKSYEGLNYKLFSPVKSEKLPLVIWMHGRGDNGFQLRSAKNAVMFAEEEAQKKNPAYVMAPQSDESPVAGRWTDSELDKIALVVKDLINSGKVDKNRVYIIGHSMGGQGTWNLLRKNPELFAAAVSMAPRVISDEAELTDLEMLKNLPVWMFHAVSDPINTVDGSRDRYNRLLEVGNTNVKYTELSDEEMKKFGIGLYSPYEYHATNVVMANTPDIVEWMFSQRKEEIVEVPPVVEGKPTEEVKTLVDGNYDVNNDKGADGIPRTGEKSLYLLTLVAAISLGGVLKIKRKTKSTAK